MTQCLEFCQALENKGRTFNINITAGNFSFSLDTRGTTTKDVERKRKKLSPSQVRRNQKRKEDYLKRKSLLSEDSSKEVNTEPVPEKAQEPNKCDICEKTFKSEGGLKTHKTRTHHKTQATPPAQTEKLRSYISDDSPLEVSLVKEQVREEQCMCCGELMAPQHQCTNTFEDEQPEEENTPNFSCELCGKTFETKHDKDNHSQCPVLMKQLFSSYQSLMKQIP